MESATPAAGDTPVPRPDAPVSASRPSLTYWAAIFGVALSILLVELFTDPDRYADIDSYVLYLDQLVHFPPNTLFIFEPLSNIYFLTLHWIFQSVMTSIVVAHYLLGLIFAVSLIWIFPRRDTAWQSVLFVFAVMGPLLAFVTLRATPAYFLIAISVHHANNRNPKVLPFFILASLFHVSATLAAVPILLLYFRDKLPRMFRIERPFVVLSATAVICILVFALPQFSSALNALVQSIPLLSKFAAYTDQTNVASVNSLNHYIFLAFIVSVSLGFISLAEPRDRRMYIYIVSSLLIYFVLFFVTSPVAAFRQAPFWVIPMIAIFPWRKAGVTGSVAPIYIAFCAGLFYVQLMQVYT